MPVTQLTRREVMALGENERRGIWKGLQGRKHKKTMGEILKVIEMRLLKEEPGATKKGESCDTEGMLTNSRASEIYVAKMQR